MVRPQDCDHVISQGSLRRGSARVDYYTTTPAPSQWIAVGVLLLDQSQEHPDDTKRLLVGNGTNERQAITNLEYRFSRTLESLVRASGAAIMPKPVVTGDVITKDSQIAEAEGTTAYH